MLVEFTFNTREGKQQLFVNPEHVIYVQSGIKKCDWCPEGNCFIKLIGDRMSLLIEGTAQEAAARLRGDQVASASAIVGAPLDGS